MSNPQVIAIADRYWADHLGCPPGELFAAPFHLRRHGAELADYRGVFALTRGGSFTASAPEDSFERIQELWPAALCPASPEEFAAALQPLAAKVIGPAFIGYATAVGDPQHPVRALAAGDEPALEALERACDPVEWEHGGSGLDQECSGAFVGGELAALAGYEVWGGAIAHISVVTHPGHRGRGLGRSVVAHLAARAIAAGLLPQYRTLESNAPSIRIAQELGFESYATSIAIRLSPPS